MKKIIAGLMLCMLCCIYNSSSEEVVEHTVLIKALTYPQNIPYKIQLNWLIDTSAVSFDVYRMEKGSCVWQLINSFDNKCSEFIDSTVNLKKAYEYKIVKNTNDEYNGYNYIAIGDSVPVNTSRGTVLLLVDDSLAAYIDSTIERFRQNLFDDGWASVKYTVARADSFDTSKIKSTKSLIDKVKKEKGEDLKAAVFIGRIPVAYSGNYAIDGHIPDHYGAWAADVYYGVPSKAWTDTVINNKGASREINWNTPKDGKWDQTLIPDSAKIAIGRIDFYNQTILGKSEVQLINEYFQKDENYRRYVFKPLYRGLIADKFHVFGGEPFAACAWMSFSAMFGYDKVDSGEFVPALEAKPYIWSYACGSSSFHHVGGNLLLEDCRDKQLQGVFSPLFGSYFADWDFNDVIMRVYIGSQPSVLVSFFDGRPYWFFHNMSLGETFAYSQLLSINNRTLYESAAQDGFKQIHMTALGDPTLRMYYFAPPENVQLKANSDCGINHISWEYNESDEDGFMGYNIYGSDDYVNTAKKLNDKIITGKYFDDTISVNAKRIYSIRAVKLEKTNSGSFINESVGTSVIYQPAEYVNEKNNNDLLLYPNPVKNCLNIYCEAYTIRSFDVYGIDGVKLNHDYYVTNEDNNCISILFNDRINPGIYFIEISFADSNNSKITKSFVKY